MIASELILRLFYIHCTSIGFLLIAKELIKISEKHICKICMNNFDWLVYHRHGCSLFMYAIKEHWCFHGYSCTDGYLFTFRHWNIYGETVQYTLKKLWDMTHHSYCIASKKHWYIIGSSLCFPLFYGTLTVQKCLLIIFSGHWPIHWWIHGQICIWKYEWADMFWNFCILLL